VKSSTTCQKWHSHTKKKERKKERKQERWCEQEGAAMWSERNNKNGNVWYEVKQVIVSGKYEA
jgi:hypothetical protein